MEDSIGYYINIDELFRDLDLGRILEKPKVVEGGLLHKSFDVVSDNGHYFVKALNPKIMLRPAAMEHFLFSDQVSRIAKEAGVPSSSVLVIQGRTIHCVDGQYYQVFDWLEGQAYKHSPHNLNVCNRIGGILGEIHKIDFTSIYRQNMEVHENGSIDWTGMLEFSSRDDLLGKLIEHVDLDYIRSIEERSRLAMDKLSTLIVSHRDLDSKNVMWGQDGLIVIDWEASGYVNAMHELIEVALYWSEFEDGSIYNDAFMEVLLGYVEVADIVFKDLEFALEAVNYNKIGWIEYNYKRALGIESNSEDECQLGYQQVIDTVKSIQKYENEKDRLRKILRKWSTDRILSDNYC